MSNDREIEHIDVSETADESIGISLFRLVLGLGTLGLTEAAFDDDDRYTATGQLSNGNSISGSGSTREEAIANMMSNNK